MFRISIYRGLGTVVLGTLLAGCATEGPGGLSEHSIGSAERNRTAVVLDPALMPSWFDKLLGKGKISFENPVSEKLNKTNILRIHSEIRNRQSDEALIFEASTVFRNRSNRIVDESRWEKIKLSPNQSIAYKINSICDADKYCVRLRSPRKNTNALNGPGINLMADKILRSLVLRSLVKHPNIFNAKNPPRIALHQFENRSNQKLDESIFLSKLRAEVNSRMPGKIIFVSRRFDITDAIEEERQKKREGILSADKSKTKAKLSGVSYFLTGKLNSLPGKDYRLFSYQLVNAENSEILWEDQFEIGDY